MYAIRLSRHVSEGISSNFSQETVRTSFENLGESTLGCRQKLPASFRNLLKNNESGRKTSRRFCDMQRSCIRVAWQRANSYICIYIYITTSASGTGAALRSLNLTKARTQLNGLRAGLKHAGNLYSWASCHFSFPFPSAVAPPPFCLPFFLPFVRLVRSRILCPRKAT